MSPGRTAMLAFAQAMLLVVPSRAPGQGAPWRLVGVPGAWEKTGGGKHDGFAWYRCFVKVPADWRGLALKLELGAIDDCDQTFFNGRRVGATGRMPPRTRPAPAVCSYVVIRRPQWRHSRQRSRRPPQARRVGRATHAEGQVA